MWNNDFINFFTNIVGKTNENETFKPTQDELMKKCVFEINEIVEYYENEGIYVVSAERGKNNKMKCNFKIIG